MSVGLGVVTEDGLELHGVAGDLADGRRDRGGVGAHLALPRGVDLLLERRGAAVPVPEIVVADVEQRRAVPRVHAAADLGGERLAVGPALLRHVAGLARRPSRPWRGACRRRAACRARPSRAVSGVVGGDLELGQRLGAAGSGARRGIGGSGFAPAADAEVSADGSADALGFGGSELRLVARREGERCDAHEQGACERPFMRPLCRPAHLMRRAAPLFEAKGTRTVTAVPRAARAVGGANGAPLGGSHAACAGPRRRASPSASVRRPR